MLLAVLVACVDPVIFGAVPDDGKPDNIALQLAIEKAVGTHADVCLGPGIWDLGPPDRSGKRGPIGSVIIHSGPLTIRGQGDSTRLRMSGDGQKRDWRGLQLLGANDVTLEDFAIDGLSATNTEEQTHLVEIGPASKHIVIARMEFGPMRTPDQRVGQGIGGDGLRMLGNPGSEVEDVIVASSRFIDCDRSGIGFQRSLRKILIIDDTITGAGDQSIDFEPTGRGAIEDVMIVGVTITKPPESQGAWAMTIVGTGNDLAHRILLANSHIDGGGILLMNVHDVVIRGNTIVQGAQTKDPTISIIRRGTDIRIEHNRLTRPASAQAGMLVRASDNNGQVPRGLVVRANDMVQGTSTAVVGLISVSDVTVVENTIHYSGTDKVPIIRADATANDIEDFVVAKNTILGRAGAVLSVSSRDHAVRRVDLSDNDAHDVASSLRCEGSGDAVVHVVLDDRSRSNVRCNGAEIVPADPVPRKQQTAPSTVTAP